MALLEYPVTRPITLCRFWKCVLVLGAIIWVTLITLVNVAAVGYELVPVTSSVFNSSAVLWYERFMPISSWIPKSRTCEWSIIKVLEGYSCLVRLTTDVSTDARGFFTYCFFSYRDAKTGSPVDGMVYEGNGIVNCSLQIFELIQPVYDPFDVQVTSLPSNLSLMLLGLSTLQHDSRGIFRSSNGLRRSQQWRPRRTIESCTVTVEFVSPSSFLRTAQYYVRSRDLGCRHTGHSEFNCPCRFHVHFPSKCPGEWTVVASFRVQLCQPLQILWSRDELNWK
jgi:hypothetical protein